MTKCHSVVMQIVAICMFAFSYAASAQQPYPARPIHFVVPFPPGGTTDVVARIVGQKLSENVRQPVIVENKAGGNTIIGNSVVAKAKPDGYTMLLIASNLVINPHLFSDIPYDAFKDFTPVATLIGTEFLLAVHSSIPASNLNEFIAFAKARPGKLNYGTSGSGGLQNLAGELFNMLAGVNIQHVPYKGGAPAIADLVAGQVQLAFNNPLALAPFISAGKLKAIAISGEQRSPVLPQVPTFSQAGMQGFSAKQWFGIVLPARAATPIVTKLSSEINKVLEAKDVVSKLESQGLDPFISSPAQLASLMKSEYEKFGKIIKTANIKAD